MRLTNNSERQNIIAQIKIGDPHGLYRVQVGLMGDDGYQYGTAGPDMANGTTSGTYVIKYPKNAEMALPDRTVINFTGGDIWTGSYMYGITEMGKFEFKIATVDADLIALVSGDTVDQVTNTRWTIYGENIMRSTPPQCCMITTFRLQSKQAGTKGANKFIHRIVSRAWIAPKGITGAPVFQAAGEYGFDVVPTVSDKMPHGISFDENQSFEENETPVFYLITDNPIHFVAHKCTSGTQPIVLPYKPVVFDYTTPDSETDPVQVVRNGIVENATSVTQATATVVCPSGTAGDYIGILYETLFETV